MNKIIEISAQLISLILHFTSYFLVAPDNAILKIHFKKKKNHKRSRAKKS